MKVIWEAIFSSSDNDEVMAVVDEQIAQGRSPRIDWEGEESIVSVISNREELAAHRAQMAAEKAAHPERFYSWIDK